MSDLSNMPPDWSVTPEKIDELIRRIVATADPLQIILFGSRARGTHRPDSDLDLAVILDSTELEIDDRSSYLALADIRMSVDLVVATRAKYDLFRPWLNSVFNYIQCEGVVLYDREHPQSAKPSALHTGSERRIHAEVPAA